MKKFAVIFLLSFGLVNGVLAEEFTYSKSSTSTSTFDVETLSGESYGDIGHTAEIVEYYDAESITKNVITIRIVF